MLKKILLLSVLLYFSSAYATNVLLKSGGVIKGKIINQDPDQITIVEENGNTRTIAKANILKTVYKDYSEQELNAIRKEEERKLTLSKQNKQLQNQKNPTEVKKNSDLILKQIVLSSSEENCSLFASKTEWFWFYGNFPLSNPNAWIELLPEDDRPIKVSVKSTWVDSSLTLLLGTLTSISRKTRQIEVCEW